MVKEVAKHGPCPLVWGDRVEHRIFGFGTVEGEPVPAFGPTSTHRQYDGVGPRGWTVTVKFDDPAKPSGRFGYEPPDTVLTKVSSPDARGHAYWEHEFGKLLGPVERTRAEVDAYVKGAFRTRPPFSAARLAELREREAAALSALQAFLEADAAGEHP